MMYLIVFLGGVAFAGAGMYGLAYLGVRRRRKEARQAIVALREAFDQMTADCSDPTCRGCKFRRAHEEKRN